MISIESINKAAVGTLSSCAAQWVGNSLSAFEAELGKCTPLRSVRTHMGQ